MNECVVVVMVGLLVGRRVRKQKAKERGPLGLGAKRERNGR